MQKSKQIKTLLLIVFILVHNFVFSQEKKWQSLPSPIYSDLKKIQFINNDTAFIAGKQLLLLHGNTCEKFKKQPPCEISNMFALNSNSVFISNTNAYQNSDLYYWNGKDWKQIANPMANNITDMYFTDSQNGILVGYGEISKKVNGTWFPVPPPSNRSIIRITQNNKREIIALTNGYGMYRLTDKWTPIKHSKKVHHLSRVNNEIYAIGQDFLGIVTADSIKTIVKDEIWSQVISITRLSNNVLIGVGYQGVIIKLKLSAEAITLIKSPTKHDLTAIASSTQTLICVGKEGNILKYTNDSVTSIPNIWKGFERISFNAAAKLIDDEYGVIAADFNHDGLVDIFTSGLFEEEHLYLNQNELLFNENAKAFNIQNNEKNKNNELHLGACAGDIDNDGFIDLYLSVLNGKNKIYKNIKGEHFVDYSYNTGATGESTDRTNACIMGDIDNDGDLDIFIANEYSTNRLFLNNGVGIFTEFTTEAELTSIEGGNSATFGDIDNDGDIDLYVTNWSSQNALYQNLFIETGQVKFKNITKESNTGGEAHTKSNAAVFSDLDNDGDLDLFVTNRKYTNRLYFNNGQGVYKDSTASLIGFDRDSSYGAVIADFDGDLYKDIYVSNVGENVFYKNNNGHFEIKTQKYGANLSGYSTGSAVADFDNDGDLDIYVANYLGASSALLRNKQKSSNQVSIQISGYQNNSDAIGTKIFVYTHDEYPKLIWFDEIRTGSGYVSQNEFRKVITIPQHESVSLKVVFPNGYSKVFPSVEAGSHLHISDSDGYKKYYYQLQRHVKKIVFDPHYLFEFLKWLFVILFIGVIGYKQKIKHQWNIWYVLMGCLFFIGLYYIQAQQFEFDSFLFSSFLPLTSVMVGVLLTHYYFEREFIKKEASIEKNRIKLKLSRDLHDDLAATVSSIGFYLTLMKFDVKNQNPKISQFIQKSQDLVADATDAITDMIWSVNPKQETLKSLLQRIQKNYQPLFIENNIQLIILKNINNINIILSDNEKQNIYLILKEGLNNILKYAEATHVRIVVAENKKIISLLLEDDGVGFEYSFSKNKGQGLQNMQNRASEIQAKLKITSIKNVGTSILIEL